ncbi:hypothetical protein NGM37_43270, partial [Streptomyces sp. TRM76130]|nr:hypothetical protein [Streptomyces sp. TRM76130]
PTDPRTPLQQVRDQMAAAHRALAGPSLSRPERAALAERIHGLEQEARRLTARFTLSYTVPTGPVTKARLSADRVHRLGMLAARSADRGEVWDITVRDEAGCDVTFDFSCFAD